MSDGNEAMTPEPEFFYYDGDEKVPLEMLDDTVAVAFDGLIPQGRMEMLGASQRPIDALGRSPTLMARDVLVHQTSRAARGAERLQRFAQRLSQGESIRYVTHTFRDPADDIHLVLMDEIIVRFKKGISQEQIEALNEALGMEIIAQNEYVPNQYLLRVGDPTAERTMALANDIHQNELVEWAVPNFVRETRPRQAGADFKPRQWHLHNTGQQGGVADEDVRAEGAWAITRGSGNVVIAILDTGVDVQHPDLQPNIHPQARNFDDPANPTDVTDTDGHGTSCAGIAAAAGNRVSGLAPRCKILPIKMIQADDNATADSLFYAAQHAQVLSNSWGTDRIVPVEAAIQDIIANGREGKGSVVLFAVGNDNVRIPAGDQSRIGGVIAIGASTNVGSRAGYSNFAEDVDNPLAQKRISLLAPGGGNGSAPGTGADEPDNSTSDIYTTDVRGAAGFSNGGNDVSGDPDYTGEFSGTSAACPLAAGAAALVLSVNADLTQAQVRYILEITADKIGTGQARPDAPPGRIPPGKQAVYDPPTGHDLAFGFGRLNAEQAVKVARGDAIRQAVPDPTGGSATLGEAIPVVLRRQDGSNRFVSEATLTLVDARRDVVTLTAADNLRVAGGPGGLLRATYQPAAGGPAVIDEVEVDGEIGSN
ncbi:MAG: S8 family serine peptidase [Chloroflexota bacterium]|jgi:subtilisin family serine protease